MKPEPALQSGEYPDYLTAVPREIAAVKDYERFAKERLNENAWAYLTGGAADEHTLSRNEQDFQSLFLKGSVLNKVKGGHTRCELFGHTYAHPILLSPVAYQRLFHPEGERASLLGASVMQASMVVSTLASVYWEELAANTHSPLWFQLYIQKDRAYTLELIKRVEAAGYQVLVVTVDAPLAGIRNREHRAHFQLPSQVGAINLKAAPIPERSVKTDQNIIFDVLMADAPTWEDIEWLVDSTTLPVVLKGILDPEDALRAEQCGASGIIVSNHGGRILDGLPSTITALPAIAMALEKRIPILLDGGIRRGSDIFKAIALGACAVLIGRPYLYALAAAGALGVAHVIRILREELEITMAISGYTSLQAIDQKSLFRPISPAF